MISLVPSDVLFRGLAVLAIKGALVFAVAMLAGLAVRKASAKTRHAMWAISFAAVLAATALAFTQPIFGFEASPPRSAGGSGTGGGALELDALRVPSGEVAGPEAASVGAAGERRPPPPSARATKESRASSIAATGALMWLWSLGAAAALGWLLFGLVRCQRIVRNAEPTSEPFLAELRRELGLPRSLRVLASSEVAFPITVGLFRPTVVLPASVSTWPDESRRLVLLHELQHVRRRDVATTIGAQLVCALHWFNPLAWHAAARLCTEREAACDDAVLSTGARPSAYAEALLQAVRGARRGLGDHVLVGAGSRSNLSRRVRAILASSQSTPSRRTDWLVLGIISLAGACVASAGPKEERRSDHPIAKRVEKGRHLWKRSCPSPAADGSCVELRTQKLEHHCGDGVVPRPRVSRREEALATRAVKEFEAALELYENGDSIKDLPADERAAVVASVAQAHFYLGERSFEAFMSVEPPTGLSFDPKDPKRAEGSKKEFFRYLEDSKTRAEEAVQRYRKLNEKKAPAPMQVAAAARSAQVFDHFARSLETMEIPEDVRAGEYAADKTDAFCDQLESESKPLYNEASQARKRCAELARAHDVDTSWAKSCRASP